MNAAPKPSYPAAVSLHRQEPLIDAIAQLAADASFEIAARDAASLEAARDTIAPGTTISVTWLPGDASDDLVAAARAIREAGYAPLPHVAARRLRDQREAERLIGRLHGEAGARGLFVIGGDVATPAGEFASALELLARLRPMLRRYDRLGVGGYPEGHPAIATAILEAQLDTKIAVIEDLGAVPFVITQFGFEAAAIVRWLEAFRARANAAPVRVGLAGPTSIGTLLRFARLCGVGASARAVAGNGASLIRVLREAGPDPVIRELAEAGIGARHGPVALHLFPFGGLLRSAEWIAPVAQGRFRLGTRGFAPRVRISA